MEGWEEEKGNHNRWDVDHAADKVFANDGWVLRTIRSCLSAGVMKEDFLEDTDKGNPLGGVISSLLANI